MSVLRHFIVNNRHRLFNVTFDSKSSQYVVGHSIELFGSFDDPPNEKTSILVRSGKGTSIKGPEGGRGYQVSLPLSDFELFEHQVEQGVKFIEIGADLVGNFELQFVNDMPNKNMQSDFSPR